jgi:hypothetical protein
VGRKIHDASETEALPIQTALTADDPQVDLSLAPNDADDDSDAGRPTTDHDTVGWRSTPPSKP